MAMTSTATTLQMVKAADQDFEWYPTTKRMIDVVKAHMPAHTKSIMDIGAGDGRVLVALAERCEQVPELYSIEKSSVLVQAQADNIIPVGTEFYEQNLACLQVETIFCNPPYSQYEQWALRIIESGHAKRAFLIIPSRWPDSSSIRGALKRRGARARTIHSDDFHDADRQARAIVDVVEVSYPLDNKWDRNVADPFDIWFDQNIHTFDREEETQEPPQGKDIERLNAMQTIPDMVAGFDAEYARMEENYRAIFKLDYVLLKELGVTKDAVRDGIKKKMVGLKAKYWHLLFERLDSITSRLSTATRKRLLEKLTEQTGVAFTTNNAYAVVLWAIKNANRYFDEQLVQLFKDLSTFDGIFNYKSNQRTWQASNWRYMVQEHDHYALEYRIVVKMCRAISSSNESWHTYEYPGKLHTGCHDMLNDVIAVMGNLGYRADGTPSRQRSWESGQWHDFCLAGTDKVLFQCKAYMNGNLHFRFMPDAMKRLNVEAGRLLGWLKTPTDVVRELDYTPAEAAAYFGSNAALGAASVKLLTAGE